MPPSCALLGGCAIGARIALLWQHNANPSYKLASTPRYDDVVRTRNVSECSVLALCLVWFCARPLFARDPCDATLCICCINGAVSSVCRRTSSRTSRRSPSSSRRPFTTSTTRASATNSSYRQVRVYVYVCPRPHAYTIARTRV